MAAERAEEGCMAWPEAEAKRDQPDRLTGYLGELLILTDLLSAARERA